MNAWPFEASVHLPNTIVNINCYYEGLITEKGVVE